MLVRIISQQPCLPLSQRPGMKALAKRRDGARICTQVTFHVVLRDGIYNHS
jgi:hypothetical protein